MSFHVAIIPDGNRRWAQTRGLPHFAGHRAGSEALETLLASDAAMEIDWFTFWAASVDNLTKRPPAEVRFLDALFAERFRALARDAEIHRRKVRIRVLGEWTRHLSKPAQAAIRETIAATAAYADRVLTILLAYDGVRDTLRAVRRVVRAARRGPSFRVTAKLMTRHLMTGGLPPVDLVIRTGGEPHWSAGFLMWHVTNAQLVFLERPWPDFTPADLAAAIREYRIRERRFGT